MNLVCCFSLIHLLTLYEFLFFGLHAHPPFYLPALLLPQNISWRIFVGCRYHHTGTWHPWQSSATPLQHHDSQRVGHGHPQYRIMQLPMTPHLHSGKLVDLVSSFVLSTLQFLSPCPVISLLTRLYFADGQYSYFGVVGRSSVYLYSRIT